MSFILMMIGILAIALGAILIGFGIPINEFSLGNTLILAGTVTAMGGLVTFAVSRAVGQLSRIADLLATRPMAVPGAPAVSAAGAVAPPVAPPPASRAPRAQAGDDFVPEPVEPLRPSPRAAPVAEEPAPSAPPAPARTGWRPPRPAAERTPPKPTAAPEPRRPSAASDNPFDSAWPEKPATPPRREPSLEPPAEHPPAGGRAEAATVLKSGIVDGMAYTLYTDGSIEAELAQGVVRFGSIEELRNHLEKSA